MSEQTIEYFHSEGDKLLQNKEGSAAYKFKRPRIITIVCSAGYSIVLGGFPQVFSPSIKKLGTFMPAIYGILVALHFISCVGLWHYKRWGVQLFITAFFAKIVFFLLISQLTLGFYLGSFISLVSILILLPHYRKMNPNL